MALDIFSLVGRVVINSSDADRAMRQTGENAKDLSKTAGDSFKTVEQAAQGAAEAAAAAGDSVKESNEKAKESTEKAAKSFHNYDNELSDVNRLLKNDSENVVLAAQKQELLEKAAEQTAKKLRSLNERLEDVAEQYRNGEIPEEQYRKFQRIIIATQQKLDGYQNELNSMNAVLDDTAETSGKAAEAVEKTGDSAEKAGDSAVSLGDKFKSALSVISKVGAAAVGAATAAAVAVGAGAVKAGTAAVESADSFDKAVKRTISATGASAEEAEKYADTIKAVYGDNFGESFDDIAISVSTVTQNLGEMDSTELKNITERAYALQDVFDMGVDESARAAKAMRDNFGISAADAYDYIAKGAQDGLNYSGELIDSINEYSVQFAKLGFSADDMFNIFSQGAENGAWDLDKIGDAVKEFSIRAIDGSDTTKAGFEAIGYKADDMMKKFAAGGDTARDAFQTVVSALAEIEDPIARDAAGVNLFGTMWEDLGVDAVAALGNISDSAYDCAGAMDGITAVNYSSLSDALDGLKRQAELLIQPLGEMLIPVISEIIGQISEMSKEIIPKIINIVQPILDKLIKFIPNIFNLINRLIPIVEKLAESILDPLMEMIDELLPPLMDFLESLIEPLTDIISAILPVIIDLIKKILPIITEVIQELLPPLLDILDDLMPLFDVVLELLDPILDLIKGLIKPIGNILKAVEPFVEILVKIIQKGLEPFMEKIDFLAPLLEDVLGNALNLITDLLNNVLLPAFDGVLKFLEGDFLGGLDSWGNAFTGVFENIFAGIDSIFGTHLSEWYDGFNDFWMEVGSRLYEMNHQGDIEMAELGAKYSGMYADLNRATLEAIRGGATAEEAMEQAKREVLDTSEKLYYYNRMMEESANPESQWKWGYNLDYVSELYVLNKNSPEPVPAALPTLKDSYREQKADRDFGNVPKLASGGMAYGDTLAVIGDNPDAAINPEVVAPLSELSAIFSRALDRAADRLALALSNSSLSSAAPITIIVRLSDDTELTRAIIDNINDCTRQDGKCVIEGI